MIKKKKKKKRRFVTFYAAFYLRWKSELASHCLFRNGAAIFKWVVRILRVEILTSGEGRGRWFQLKH